MSWLCFLVISTLFFIPPFSFAQRLYPSDSGLVLFLIVVAFWILLWFLSTLPFRYLGLRGMDSWLGGLIESTQPLGILLVLPILALLVIFLAFGGIQIINLALNTRFTLSREVVVLSFFALIAETGRLIEVAMRDERQWLSQNALSQTVNAKYPTLWKIVTAAGSSILHRSHDKTQPTGYPEKINK